MTSPHHSIGRWVKRIALGISFAAFAILLALWGWQHVLNYGLSLHQSGIAREIANWGKELSVIRSDSEAKHAEEMIEYIKGYYPVASGYQSNTSSDVELEQARRRAIQGIQEALSRYRAGQEQPSAKTDAPVSSSPSPD